ncbi:hypothetical protein KQH49_00315 [Mycetohabitans sp. B5]|nr:hypothetical protein [Mycetohabitans sp. B5]
MLNPKVMVFFASFFSQFVSVYSAHKSSAFLVLGVGFAGLGVRMTFATTRG